MPFVETAPLVERNPNNPPQAAGLVTLPQAVRLSVSAVMTREKSHTVSSNDGIQPWVGSNGSGTP